MKKLIVALAIGVCGATQAQITDTCEVWFNDTVAYVDAKTSSYLGISISQVNDGGSYGYAGYAQKFEAPDTVTINGVCFYGVMDSGGSFSAAVKMYDGTSGSPGAMIAGTSHVIPYFGSGYTGAMNDQSVLQCAMFSAPVQWEGDYFLGIENFSSSDMYVARNADGDGAAEALSYTYYKGVSDPTYDGWYEMYSFGAGWNFDMIIRPVVSYHSSSVMTYDTSMCFGDTLNIAYAYSIDDSLMYNKFYNPNFATYDGSLDSVGLDYGDLTAPTLDTFHTYTSGGNYNITFTTMASTSGWGTDNFMSQCQYATEVIDPGFDVADQTACSGDTVYFVAPSSYDSYLWSDLFTTNDSLVLETFLLSNGDYTYYVDVDLDGCAASDTMILTIGDLDIDLGGDTTLCLNQDITLTAGTYDSYDWNTGQVTETIQVGPFANPGSEEIILNVMSGSCTGTDTLLITIDNCLGVEEGMSADVEIYPNPSNGRFIISAEALIQSVAIYGLTGELIAQRKEGNDVEFSFPELAAGTYLMQVETSFGVVYKKIQIIH